MHRSFRLGFEKLAYEYVTKDKAGNYGIYHEDVLPWARGEKPGSPRLIKSSFNDKEYQAALKKLRKKYPGIVDYD